jgi:hypothetical protein
MAAPLSAAPCNARIAPPRRRLATGRVTTCSSVCRPRNSAVAGPGAAPASRRRASSAVPRAAPASAEEGAAAEREQQTFDSQPCRAEDPDCAYDESVPAGAEADADAGPPLEPLPPLPGQQLSFSRFDSGLTAEVTRCDAGDYHVRVTGPPGAGYVLHWGVDNWQLPPAGAIPPGSEQAGDRAVRTAFAPAAGGAAVTLALAEAACPERLVFVVHDVAEDVWIRDHSANFSLPLRWARRAAPRAAPARGRAGRRGRWPVRAHEGGCGARPPAARARGPAQGGGSAGAAPRLTPTALRPGPAGRPAWGLWWRVCSLLSPPMSTGACCTACSGCWRCWTRPRPQVGRGGVAAVGASARRRRAWGASWGASARRRLSGAQCAACGGRLRCWAQLSPTVGGGGAVFSNSCLPRAHWEPARAAESGICASA